MTATIPLETIAHARSGDKGNHANIGVIAYTGDGFRFLEQELTEERIARFFAALQPRAVQRFVLPGISAFNFLLYDVLAGGAGRSLRSDSQGKTLGPAVLQLRLPEPGNLADMLPPSA